MNVLRVSDFEIFLLRASAKLFRLWGSGVTTMLVTGTILQSDWTICGDSFSLRLPAHILFIIFAKRIVYSFSFKYFSISKIKLGLRENFITPTIISIDEFYCIAIYSLKMDWNFFLLFRSLFGTCVLTHKMFVSLEYYNNFSVDEVDLREL